MTVGNSGAYDEETRSRLAQLQAVAQSDGLPFDGPTRQVVECVLTLLDDLRRTPSPADPHAREQRMRAARQLAAACRLAFDWRSPGYAQSGVLSVGDIRSLVGDLDALRDAPVNYARWHQPGIDELERALGAQIGIVEERDALLATSSGLAALSVALGTLRKTGRLRKVLIVPGTYFETRPTLKLFGPGEIREASSGDVDDIAAEAASWGADVVFADPLEHGPEQRIVDVERLAERLGGAADDMALVLDGTMVPTSGVFAKLASRAAPLIIYYESCAKYRHLGLDMALGGAVVVPRRYYANNASEVRQSLGAMPDRFSCEVALIAGPTEASARLDAMERAAGIIASSVSDRLAVDWRVVHPSLPSHPQTDLAVRRRYLGACVTFVPEDQSAQRVLRFVKRAIELARDAGVALVAGESLGFTACRLTPTVAAAGVRPFARLATGPLEDQQAATVAAVLTRAASHP
jgi:cystathionine beta-lyase/cystathionine gamma-synthase